MAPQQPAEGLQQRLTKLAQTLQFAWFCGHVALLFCTIRYSLSYITFNYYSRWAKFSYRTAFVAAAATYGIVVFKGYRARQKQGKAPSTPLALLGDENVQYLAMALVWLFSKQTALALLPFAVYSFFHVATYTRSVLIPTIQPAAATATGQKPATPSGIAEKIGAFVRDYYDTSMSLVAGLEIALWFRLFGSALLFQRGSWILIVVYTVFLRARISQSTFVQGMIRHLSGRVDAVTNRQDIPPAARQTWDTVKGLAKKAYDATDFTRAAQGQTAPKKAQ